MNSYPVRLLLALAAVAPAPLLAAEFVLGVVGGTRVTGQVEAGWSVVASPSPVPEVASVRLTYGTGPEAVIPVTALMPPPGAPTPGEADMARLVEASAQRAAPQSVEGTLQVVLLPDGRGPGFHFSATDEAPKPGEFRSMSQGLSTLDGLTVSFTALSNGDAGHDRDAMLRLVGSLQGRPANQAPGRCGNGAAGPVAGAI